MADEHHPLIGFGSRIRVSPFYAATRRYGCRAYTVYNHMYLPLYYESPEADYWKLVTDVTLWDVAAQRQVEITGADAARFAQYLTPRNLESCAVGQCKYVLLTDHDGGVVNDLLLLKLARDRFWLSLADSDGLLWARGAAINSGMDVRIDEPDVSPLQVQGPKATDTMVRAFGSAIGDLGLFRFVEMELDGMPLLISRTGWSGERGYEVFLRDRRYGDELWDRIMEAGRPFDIAPSGPSAIRRIEAGLLSYGADISLASNPYEINLGRLVDLDQSAEFIGKEALKRIRARGIRRRLVGLEMGGDPLAAPNVEFWSLANGASVDGMVTSCVYSPRLEKNIGIAMLSMDKTEVGTRVVAHSPAGELEARVVPLPFIPHRLK